jgi:hypothetical protein
VGGASLDPFAYAGSPSTNLLQPLTPETRILNGRNSSSIHSPKVVLDSTAFGSTCHHLQSLQSPHELLITLLLEYNAVRGRFLKPEATNMPLFNQQKYSRSRLRTPEAAIGVSVKIARDVQIYFF